jgi:hypothetical protein
MGNTKELILAYPSMKQVTAAESVNVILPPQFYTVKKELLPLRYAYQAKKIAPSLFEGLLEEGKAYDYMVWKEDEKWVFLAYDLEMISEFLQSKGFALENIGKIFFAQQVAEKFDKPLLLGENEALISLDDMIVVVPKRVLDTEEESTLTIDNSFTPKKGVAIHRASGSILNKKQASVLTVIFVLFSLMFFVEGWRYGHSTQAGESKMQELLQAYPSLQSKYTRDSIIGKYKTIDTLERKKRDMIKIVSSMIFKGVTLTSLQMDGKMLKAQFTCKDATVAKRVKTLAKENQMTILAIASGSNDVSIEGAL